MVQCVHILVMFWIFSFSLVNRCNFSDLQLHGDDVYFTFEDSTQDETQQRDGILPAKAAQSKVWVSNFIAVY